MREIIKIGRLLSSKEHNCPNGLSPELTIGYINELFFTLHLFTRVQTAPQLVQAFIDLYKGEDKHPT